MTAEDWYRNKEWTERIAARFEEKLQKARRKEQYLRIQASTLAAYYPEIALALLDRYFALPDDFDHAQAHVDRAIALLSLARIDEAIASYEAALNREASFPKLLTQAYVDLPYLIAVHGLETNYDRVLELLDKHKARLMFPVDHFKWHAARALISASCNDDDGAKADAKLALEAASRDKSGFQRHPSVGLVTSRQNEVLQRLAQYCDA